MPVAPSVAPLLFGSLFYGKCGKCEKYRWLPCSLVLCFMGNVENVKNMVAPSVAPLLIGYLFYRKCRKCEKYRWFSRWLPCSLVLCLMGNVENVKNIGGSLSCSVAHWLSVL